MRLISLNGSTDGNNLEHKKEQWSIWKQAYSQTVQMTDLLNIAKKNSCCGLIIVYDHFLWGSEMCLDISLIHQHATNTSSIESYSVWNWGGYFNNKIFIVKPDKNQ